MNNISREELNDFKLRVLSKANGANIHQLQNKLCIIHISLENSDMKTNSMVINAIGYIWDETNIYPDFIGKDKI